MRRVTLQYSVIKTKFLLVGNEITRYSVTPQHMKQTPRTFIFLYTKTKAFDTMTFSHGEYASGKGLLTLANNHSTL